MNKGQFPFVSVIIPVYNDSDRLKKCLSALENQSYPSERYEIVVIDNNSDEDNAAVVQPFPHVVLTSESKRGSYAARNKGLALAKGTIIAFTDSDCLPVKQWIEEGVRALTSTSNCGLVGGRIKVFFHHPHNPTPVELYEGVFAFRQDDYIYNHHYAATGNAFTYREVLDEVGLFDSDLKSGGDLEWGNRVYAAGYELIYAEKACIGHPARRSLNEICKKSARTLGGAHDAGKSNFTLMSIVTKGPKLFWNYGRKALYDNQLEGLWQKGLVLFVLVMVNLSRLREKFRLLLGGKSRY